MVVEFQVIEYGEAVSSVPKLFPSSWNCTPTTPTLSDALAETATDEPDTVALFAGAVIETVGAIGSELEQDALPAYRAWAGSIFVFEVKSGPKAGHEQLPKNAGFEE